MIIKDIQIGGGPAGVVPESPGSALAFAASTMHRAGLHAMDKPPRPASFVF